MGAEGMPLLILYKERRVLCMEKVATVLPLHDSTAVERDLKYWLGRSSSERIAAVEQLREQYYGTLPRLQRVARVVKRS